MTDDDKLVPDSFVEDLGKGLTPKDIAADATRFERDLGRLFLPTAGMNGFLIGTLLLLRWEPQYQLGFAILLILAGAAAVLLLWLPRYSGSQSLLTGGFAAFFIAAVSFQSTLLYPAAILVCGVFVIALKKGILQGSLAWFFIPYIPISISFLSPAGSATDLAFEAAVLVALFAACSWIGQRKAAFAVLLSATGMGLFGVVTGMANETVLAFALCAFVFASAVYERRAPVAEQSQLRQFLGHGVTAGLLLMLSSVTIWEDVSVQAGIWAWAIALTVYEGLFLRIERVARPVRVGWMFLALALAILNTTDIMNWYGQLLFVLILAAVLCIIAVRLTNRFLSHLASLMIFLVAYRGILSLRTTGASVHSLLVCLAAAFGFLLLSRREITPSTVIWWRGFFQEDHIDTFRRYAHAVVKAICTPLTRIGILRAFVDIFKTVLTWLKYIRGEKPRPLLDDLLFTVGCVVGCAAVSEFVYVWLMDFNLGVRGATIAASGIWFIWGFLVVLHGLKQSVIFNRVIGILFIIFPLLREPILRFSWDRVVLAGLLVGAGLTLAAVGVLRRAGTVTTESIETTDPQQT